MVESLSHPGPPARRNRPAHARRAALTILIVGGCYRACTVALKRASNPASCCPPRPAAKATFVVSDKM